MPVEGFYIFPYPKGFNRIPSLAFHQSIVHLCGWWIPMVFIVKRASCACSRTQVQSFIFGKMQTDILYQWITVQYPESQERKFDHYRIWEYSCHGTRWPYYRQLFFERDNRAVYEDSEGRIWIGGSTGLHFLWGKGDRKIIYSTSLKIWQVIYSDHW